jgi:tRNA A-37 threonylcarbamoyl transferase component Bud32
MSFLEEGDVFDGGYTLLSFVGGGRTSVVWKAYSKQQDRFVAVKILRHSYLDDESIYRQFHYTARVMGELSAASIAAVREEVRQIEVNGARKLVYYVLEYIEGDSLDTYSAAHPERREKLIDGLLAVGDCIADAHAKGIVHRDLKPSNIIVDTSGRLRLVDFDSVLRLGDRRISHHDVGTFGYSAPEVLEGAVDPDVRADIFALGRVFSYLYYGRSLPSAYALSVYDLIDLLNCTPAVKSSLERACAVSPSERYATMTAFLEELQTAIREDRERALPAIATLRRERPKIARLLRHSFYGTLAAMIVARPILAHFNVVHLSDKASVGAFHGIIGSLVWGTFISGAFILYLVLLGRRMRTSGARYIAASLCCGIGGLLGGVLVSVPSVFVTNQYTLTCLGWLTDMNAPRLGSALLGTRMMLSFPLVGTLTGLGLGLCLVRGISIALRLNPQGSGILPVPAKRSPRSPEAGASLASPLLSSLLSHLFLAFPVILSFLIVLVFNAPNPADPSCSFQPNVNLRTFGEGVVHYLGAIGLTIGFFRGVRAGGST